MKNTIKKILKPLYWKLVNRVLTDLRLAEQERLLHHIIGDMEKVKQKEGEIKSQLFAIATYLTGIKLQKNPIFSEYDIIQKTIDEFTAMYQEEDDYEIDPVIFFSRIKKLKLAQKKICLLGAKNELYRQQLKRLGASRIISIETSPLNFTNRNVGSRPRPDTYYAAPGDFGKLPIPPCDILLVPRVCFSSFLIKNRLSGLGTKIKEAAVLKLIVNHTTVFGSDVVPKIWEDKDDQEMVYNDNYVRSELHQAGFSETVCLYSEGEGVDHDFDRKVSRFAYENGSYTVRDNPKPARLKPYLVSTKIYLAQKLPSVKITGHQ